MTNSALVADRDGRTVVLTDVGWQHIVDTHSDMSDRQADVLRAVAAPDVVTTDASGRLFAYRVVADHGGPRPMYVKVCVSYRVSGGTIVTAYLTRRIPRKERRL
jgi:hypothetical protein